MDHGAVSIRPPARNRHVGVVAVDPRVRSDIKRALRASRPADPDAAGPLETSLKDCLRAPIAVLVFAGALTADVARSIKHAKQRRPDLRIVVVPPSGRLKARHALRHGVDGVVELDAIDVALAPTIEAVLSGQAVAPGCEAGDLITPVLSHREKETLALVALGLANSEIASRLFISTATVKRRLTTTFGKLGVSSRSEAAALALDRETALGRSLAVPIERERALRGARSRSIRAARSVAPNVPFVDLERQHAQIGEELRAAASRVIAASAFTLGEEVELFERDFAAYCGVEHCVGISSGTAALSLALRAAGVGPGDEVIVPAHTFIASALAIIHAGATPVLCDVDPAVGLISPEAAAASITSRTTAVIAVHLYGQVCDMTALTALAERHGIALFEDAAQAHGATFADRRAGSFGTASAFSFYPSKNLGALGDGGAICTNDAAIAERARCLRNLGQRGKGDHSVIGVNERLDGIQAAFLRTKLPYLDGWNAARAKCAARYRETLPAAFWTAEGRPGATAVNHVFPVRVDERARVATLLGENGVQTGVHYARALHQHKALADLPGMPSVGAFPASEAWAGEELSLPMFPALELHEVDHVVETCRKVMDGDARVKDQ